jgi:hypothetical protein
MEQSLKKCRICGSRVSRTAEFRKMDTGIRHIKRISGDIDTTIITYEYFISQFRLSMADYELGAHELPETEPPNRGADPGAGLHGRVKNKDPLTLLYLRNYIVMCLRHYQTTQIDTGLFESPYQVGAWLDMCLSITNCAQRLQATVFLKRLPKGGRIKNNEVAGIFLNDRDHMYHRLIYADKNMFRSHPVSIPIGHTLSYYTHLFMHDITPMPESPYVFHLPDDITDPRGQNNTKTSLEQSAALRAYQVSYTNHIHQFISSIMGLHAKVYPAKESKLGNGPYHFLRSIFLNAVGTQFAFNKRKLDYVGCLVRNQLATIQGSYINQDLVTAYAISRDPLTRYTTLIDIEHTRVNTNTPHYLQRLSTHINSDHNHTIPSRLLIATDRYVPKLGIYNGRTLSKPPFSRAPKYSLYGLEYPHIYFLHGLTFEKFMDGCFTLLSIHENHIGKMSGACHVVWNEYTAGHVPSDISAMYLMHKLSILCALMRITNTVTNDLILFQTDNMGTPLRVTRQTTNAKMGRIIRYIELVTESENGSALSRYSKAERVKHYRRLRAIYVRCFEGDDHKSSAKRFVADVSEYVDNQMKVENVVEKGDKKTEKKSGTNVPRRAPKRSRGSTSNRIHIGVDASPNCIALAIHETKHAQTRGCVFLRLNADNPRKLKRHTQTVRFQSADEFKTAFVINYHEKGSDMVQPCAKYLLDTFTTTGGRKTKHGAEIIVQQEADIPGSSATLTHQIDFNRELTHAIKKAFSGIAHTHFTLTRLPPKSVRLFYCNFKLPTQLRNETESKKLYSKVLSYNPSSKLAMCTDFKNTYKCIKPTTGWPFHCSTQSSSWISYDGHPLTDIIDSLQLCFHSVAQRKFKADPDEASVLAILNKSYHPYACLSQQQDTSKVAVSNLQFIIRSDHQHSLNTTERSAWLDPELFGSEILRCYGLGFLDRRDGRLVQTIQNSIKHRQYALSTFRQHLMDITDFRRYMLTSYTEGTHHEVHKKFETWSKMISNRAKFIINSDWVRGVLNTPRSAFFYSEMHNMFQNVLNMDKSVTKNMGYILSLYVVIQLRNVFTMTSRQAFSHAIRQASKEHPKGRITNLDKIILSRISIRRNKDGHSIDLKYAKQNELTVDPGDFVSKLFITCIKQLRPRPTHKNTRVSNTIQSVGGEWYSLDRFINNKDGVRYMYKYWFKLLMACGIDVGWWDISQVSPHVVSGNHMKRFLKMCHMGVSSQEISTIASGDPDRWVTQVRQVFDCYRIQVDESGNYNQVMTHLTRCQEANFLLTQVIAKRHFDAQYENQVLTQKVAPEDRVVTISPWSILQQFLSNSISFLKRYSEYPVHCTRQERKV